MKTHTFEFPFSDSAMGRRSFLKLVAVAAAVHGCGSSDGNESGGGTVVTGRIASPLLFPGLQVGSSRGASMVTGDTFTTTISDDGTGILALADGEGRVRGFSLTFPGETPGFDVESTALAIIFLEPGMTTVDPVAAKALVRGIRALPGFADFVAFLAEHSEIPLDLLSGEADFIVARDAVVAALGSQLPVQQSITVHRDGDRVHLSNPSLRFLRVVRRDDDGDHVLEELLPPYGTLVDRVAQGSGEVQYLAAGAGFAVPTSLEDALDDALLGKTYGPTAFFSLMLPILELVGGNRISVEDGLRLYASREPLPHQILAESLASGHSPTVEAAVMDTEAIHISDWADSVTDSFSQVAELITAGSYLAGLGFSIGAIMKFKQHKDNPTQTPIGTPIALVFIAAALLFLPSILGVTAPRAVETR
jgi:hypothetical protein